MSEKFGFADANLPDAPDAVKRALVQAESEWIEALDRNWTQAIRGALRLDLPAVFDAFVRFASVVRTLVPRTILSVPFSAVETTIPRDFKWRVTPLYETARTMVNYQRDLLFFLLNLDESSLVEFFLTHFIRLMWTLSKRIPFLLQLMKIRTLAQFTTLLIATLKKSVVIQAVFAVEGFFQLRYALTATLLLPFYMGTIRKTALSQDSRRRYVSGVAASGVRRFNLRPGPDKTARTNR